MEYPDDFSTPAFPAGGRIALSRTLGIWVMVVFLLTIFVCGVLLWVHRSHRIDPVLVQINSITGEWLVLDDITRRHDQNVKIKNVNSTRLTQEYVVGNFILNFFTISADDAVNQGLWADCSLETDCKLSAKTSSDKMGKVTGGAICCLSSPDVFDMFKNSVLPLYNMSFINGELWRVNIDKMSIVPAGVSGYVSAQGGLWRVIFTIETNMNETMEIMAFVNVGYDIARYPRTMGYYVTKMDSYNITRQHE